MNNDNDKIIELAFDAQMKANEFATKTEGETLPYPPAGFPPLTSIVGEGLHGATVLGYIIGAPERIVKFYDSFGRIKNPGDAGFFDAQLSRFYSAHKMPHGWRVEHSTARFIYAIISGNPILLEEPAREMGYTEATATSASFIRLSEYY